MNSEILEKIKKYLNEKKYYKCYQLKEWRGKGGLREQALIRDHYECQDCYKKGKYNQAEEVHHVKELKTHPHLFLELNNVICLCKDCHNKRHKRDRRGINAKKQKKKFETPERW